MLCHGSLSNDVQILEHGFEEIAATLGRIDQLLQKKGVAVEDEEIAHEAHEQAGRAASDPLAAQFFHIIPDRFAKKLADNEAVVGGGKIIWDFAVGTGSHGLA